MISKLLKSPNFKTLKITFKKVMLLHLLKNFLKKPSMETSFLKKLEIFLLLLFVC